MPVLSSDTEMKRGKQPNGSVDWRLFWGRHHKIASRESRLLDSWQASHRKTAIEEPVSDAHISAWIVPDTA